MSLIGGDGDYPPTDEAGFLDFARSLRSPASTRRSRTPSRLTSDRRLARDREPLAALRSPQALARRGGGAGGRGVCVQPGLRPGDDDRGPRRRGPGPLVAGRSSRRGPGRGRDFQRELARAIAAPWLLATGADYRFRTTEGPPQGRSRG